MHTQVPAAGSFDACRQPLGASPANPTGAARLERGLRRPGLWVIPVPTARATGPSELVRPAPRSARTASLCRRRAAAHVGRTGRAGYSARPRPARRAACVGAIGSRCNWARAPTSSGSTWVRCGPGWSRAGQPGLHRGRGRSPHSATPAPPLVTSARTRGRRPALEPAAPEGRRRRSAGPDPHGDPRRRRGARRTALYERHERAAQGRDAVGPGAVGEPRPARGDRTARARRARCAVRPAAAHPRLRAERRARHRPAGRRHPGARRPLRPRPDAGDDGPAST